MRSTLAVLLLLAMTLPCAALAAYENPSVVGQVPGRVLLVLAPEVSPTVQKAAGRVSTGIAALDRVGDRFQVEDVSPLYEGVPASKAVGAPDLTRHWAVDFPPELDLETVVAAYEALPEVARAYPVDICRLYDVPNDPSLPQQWYLRNTSVGQKDIRAVGGWAAAHGDTNVVVAIVDSGVDWQHPDLGGSGPDYVNGAIWTNWVEYYGTPGVDDDANGKIDDIRGWDFVNVPGQGYPDEDDETPDNDPMDYEGHGTGCAGCAAAITDNGTGIAGTSWGCKILPVRVGWLPDGASIGVVRMDFASQGMIYAASEGADIINCSWGSSSYLSTAVNYCISQGCIIVTAAGNDNDEVASYLAGLTDVLAVAATDANDGKAGFSSYGTWVELSAPGVNIYTTYYNRVSHSSAYATVSGTSFSSPITCGAAALIWSAHPAWNRTQVIDQLLGSCDDLDAINPLYAGKLGAGRVNLLRALGDGFLEVPDEFPTLLDAMNEGAPDDTVAVLASFAINAGQTVPSRTLTVLGGWADGYGSRDPIGTPTVITANGTVPALTFLSGAPADLVVDGFRCTGGGGQYLASYPIGGRYGGGVLVNNGSPTLRNLDLTGNNVGNNSQLGCGGGIALLNSSSLVQDCRIHANGAVRGSGVYVYLGGPTLQGCQIEDNVPVTDNATYPPLGGGVHAWDTDLTVQDCAIGGHQGLENGGGIYAAEYGAGTTLTVAGGEIQGNTARTRGAGIYLIGDAMDVTGTAVRDNGPTPDATFLSGGGIYASAATVSLDTLEIAGNTATIGGGVYLDSCASGDVVACLAHGNTSTISGGAFYLFQVLTGSLVSNTVADNAAPGSGGAGISLTGGSPIISNNIVAFNTGAVTFANGFMITSAAPQFLCNIVYENAGADYGGIADQTGSNGNLRADPLFCDRESQSYWPTEDSPAAPANSGGCGLIGALAVAPCLVGVDDRDDGEAPPAVFRVDQAYPNPFNPTTTIRFALPEAGRTTVRIYDLAGRLVRTLLDERMPAAVHSITWNGRDSRGRTSPAGVYFYRVRSGDHLATGRVALVK